MNNILQFLAQYMQNVKVVWFLVIAVCATIIYCRLT